MFKQIVDAVRQMVLLLRDVEQNKQDVAVLKEQLAETNRVVTEIAFELQRINERERNEREKSMLKIENMLLRFEREASRSSQSKKLK